MNETVVGSSTDRYKFTGKERDKETGLDYFGARYYDSELGVWHTIDPMADKYPGWSSYNYCFGNPMGSIDPDGKEPFALTAAATGTVLLGSAAIVYGSYKAVEYSINNNGRMPTQLEMTASIIKTSVDVFNNVKNLFSSDKEGNSPENGDEIKEQAGKLSKDAGKNSVTLPDGTRVDLQGRGHKDPKGEKIDTPHVHDVKKNTNPKTGQTYITNEKIPRPATHEDLDKAEKQINSN